jgi:hypothetical protein
MFCARLFFGGVPNFERGPNVSNAFIKKKQKHFPLDINVRKFFLKLNNNYKL